MTAPPPAPGAPSARPPAARRFGGSARSFPSRGRGSRRVPSGGGGAGRNSTPPAVAPPSAVTGPRGRGAPGGAEPLGERRRRPAGSAVALCGDRGRDWKLLEMAAAVKKRLCVQRVSTRYFCGGGWASLRARIGGRRRGPAAGTDGRAPSSGGGRGSACPERRGACPPQCACAPAGRTCGTATGIGTRRALPSPGGPMPGPREHSDEHLPRNGPDPRQARPQPHRRMTLLGKSKRVIHMRDGFAGSRPAGGVRVEHFPPGGPAAGTHFPRTLLFTSRLPRDSLCMPLFNHRRDYIIGGNHFILSSFWTLSFTSR